MSSPDRFNPVPQQGRSSAEARHEIEVGNGDLTSLFFYFEGLLLNRLSAPNRNIELDQELKTVSGQIRRCKLLSDDYLRSAIDKEALGIARGAAYDLDKAGEWEKMASLLTSEYSSDFDKGEI